MPNLKKHHVSLDDEKDYLESSVEPVRSLIDETLSEEEARTDYARVVMNAIKLQERWINHAFLETPHETVVEFQDKVERLSDLEEFHGDENIRDVESITEGFKSVVRQNLANEHMEASPEERIKNVKSFLIDRLSLDTDIDFIERKLDKLIKQNLIQESFKDIYDDSDVASEIYQHLS